MRKVVTAVAVLIAVVASGVAPRGVCAGGDAAPNATALEAVLEDSAGKRWSLAELAGQPVLLVVADRSASRAAARWGERLAASRGERLALWGEPGKLVVVSIADLRAVPAFARAMARLVIATFVTDEDQARAGPPLLLDWEGTVAGTVGARSGEPSLRLLAADGRVETAIDGEVSDDRLGHLGAAIDRVLAPSTHGTRPAATAERDPRQEGEP